MLPAGPFAIASQDKAKDLFTPRNMYKRVPKTRGMFYNAFSPAIAVKTAGPKEVDG
jgi:hypothetical protein